MGLEKVLELKISVDPITEHTRRASKEKSPVVFIRGDT